LASTARLNACSSSSRSSSSSSSSESVHKVAPMQIHEHVYQAPSKAQLSWWHD
jgi:hypothetical protein